MPTSPMLVEDFAVRLQGDTAVIVIPEKLHLPNHQVLRHKVVEGAARARDVVVLNFSRCKYIDAASFGTLVSLNVILRGRSAELQLCNLSPELRELFGVLNLDNYFKIIDE